MILSGLGNRSAISRVERIIYRVIFFLPLAFLGFMMVPFIGIGMGLLFHVSFIGDRSMIVYSDKKIRIERPYYRFLGTDPPLVVYRKDGLFSHRYTEVPMQYNNKKDRLEITRTDDSTYHLVHYAPDNWQVHNGSEEFMLEIHQ